jgi:hypothetical protein
METNNNVYNSEDEIELINPWKRPFSNIVWGLILTSFNLNLFKLQYILSTVGIVLLYLGFRELCKVNRWFHITWILATIRLVWQLIQLLMYATPFNLIFKDNIMIAFIITIFQIVFLITFRNGIHTVYRQAGFIKKRDPIVLLIVWTIVVAFIALTPYASIWLIFIPLIILYIIFITSLSDVGNDLSSAKNEFNSETLKMNHNLFALGYCICCLILVSIGCIISNHIPLDMTPRAQINDSDIRTELLDLGFPKDIMTDISDEDISRLSGAINVQIDQNLLTFDSILASNQFNSRSHIKNSEPSYKGLNVTTIYVELPDKLIYVIEYFDWNDRKAYWQDGFTIFGADDFELINGVLLFKKNGVDYTAPIPRLNCKYVTSYSMFGANESKKISGAVSFPFRSVYQRGYIFYCIKLPKEKWVGSNCFNYVHNSHPFQFPYDEIEQQILKGSLFFRDNLEQHYTNFFTQDYREANP